MLYSHYDTSMCRSKIMIYLADPPVRSLNAKNMKLKRNTFANSYFRQQKLLNIKIFDGFNG